MIDPTNTEKLCISHLGLVVSDLAKSRDFYCELFGFEEQDRFDTEELTIVYLSNGGLILELLKYRIDPLNHREAGRFDHLAFMVTDMDHSIYKLKSCGIQFLFDEPRQVFGGKTIIFLLGPDGERIELVQES